MAPRTTRGASTRASLSIADLLPLRCYGQARPHQKQRLIAHRRERSLTLGPCMWLQFDDELPRHPRVFAEANEDLADRHLARLSGVHFLRFQFPEPLRVAPLAGASATLGCAHDPYAFRRLIPMATLVRLRGDLAAH